MNTMQNIWLKNTAKNRVEVTLKLLIKKTFVEWKVEVM